ncbi:luciferase domain-containing protein [Mucilaginibacter conchicola]|uniref:luciferase domain-containing protein n=1 Tax=Mucilaginibacter conchicola TaxID=2303333 RepID=UPI001F2846F8|nr:luciferase family protein [Mucilaginibacter conchicola]
MLRFFTLLFNPKLLIVIDDIEAEVGHWPDIVIHTHKYGGLQFDIYGKELGHIHSNGLLDMPFSKAIKQQLMADDRRVNDHHSFINSGWISFYMNHTDDKILAIQLFKINYQRLKKHEQENITAHASL